VVAALDELVGRVARDGVPAEELARVKTKLVSDLYSGWEQPLRRADALAIAQLFSGDAASLNALPARIRAVSSDDLRRVAATALAATNRTVVDRRPAPPPAAPAK
jgi:predicted Zn-dependent peptidase